MKENSIDLAMKNRQAAIAYQMAAGKERFWYYSILVGLAFTCLPPTAFLLKKPVMMASLVPMAFGWTF